MKRVLREAFRADLPADIVFRPKCATRDATGVRNVLEDAFGTSRDRYRQVFHDLFRDERGWPGNLIRGLQTSKRKTKFP